MSAWGELLVIEPIDCGPLGRQELGVSFSVLENGKRKMYFAKAKAGLFAQSSLSESKVFGYVLDLCRIFHPKNWNENRMIKGFKFD